jgi:hypothetical protein
MSAPVERVAGNVRVCCQAFGIPQNVLRSALATGAVRSYSAGRRTVILYSHIEQWIVTLKQPQPLRGVRPAAVQDDAPLVASGPVEP